MRITYQLEIAALVGERAASLFETIIYWCFSNAGKKSHLKNGQYWMYNTYEDFLKTYPHLTRRQIELAVGKLEQAGLIIIDNFNSKKYDRTQWFTYTEKSLKLSTKLVKISKRKKVRYIEVLPYNTVNENGERIVINMNVIKVLDTKPKDIYVQCNAHEREMAKKPKDTNVPPIPMYSTSKKHYNSINIINNISPIITESSSKNLKNEGIFSRDTKIPRTKHIPEPDTQKHISQTNTNERAVQNTHENTPTDLKSIYERNAQIAKQKRTAIQKRNNDFIKYSSFLANVIQTKKNVKITQTKITNWANSIRLLHEVEEVSLERIGTALRWYEHNIGKPYVPVIESGNSFREKFIRLEDAIKRSTTRNDTIQANGASFYHKEGALDHLYASKPTTIMSAYKEGQPPRVIGVEVNGVFIPNEDYEKYAN